ncbi:unnamed protein product [Tilletia controversa]|nr:unnamed protein product [Tilletia controversa]CAD6969165.1 unnamed protein product [Tilletia controversa]
MSSLQPINLRALFPARPHSDKPGRVLATSSSPTRWTWTEHESSQHRPLPLCSFTSSCHADPSSSSFYPDTARSRTGVGQAEHEDSADDHWDGILPPVTSLAILASLPFGCVLHFAAAHAHASLQRDEAVGCAGVTLLTTATKDAVRANLVREEVGGVGMAWMVAGMDAGWREALGRVEIVHLTSVEDLMVIIAQLRSTLTGRGAESHSAPRRPSLLIVEGLSHLLHSLDVRQFTYILTLLHGLTHPSPAPAQPQTQTQTQLILIDDELEDLRLALCPSLHRQHTQQQETPETSGLDPWVQPAPPPAPPPPPVEYQQEVSLVPILLRSFDWVGTSTTTTSTTGMALEEEGEEEGADQRFRLVLKAGDGISLSRLLGQRGAAVGPGWTYYVDVSVQWD